MSRSLGTRLTNYIIFIYRENIIFIVDPFLGFCQIYECTDQHQPFEQPVQIDHRSFTRRQLQQTVTIESIQSDRLS